MNGLHRHPGVPVFGFEKPALRCMFWGCGPFDDEDAASEAMTRFHGKKVAHCVRCRRHYFLRPDVVALLDA